MHWTNHSGRLWWQPTDRFWFWQVPGPEKPEYWHIVRHIWLRNAGLIPTISWQSRLPIKRQGRCGSVLTRWWDMVRKVSGCAHSIPPVCVFCADILTGWGLAPILPSTIPMIRRLWWRISANVWKSIRKCTKRKCFFLLFPPQKMSWSIRSNLRRARQAIMWNENRPRFTGNISRR